VRGAPAPGGGLRRFFGSDFFYAFLRSPAAGGSFLVVVACVAVAALAPLLAPQNPFDLGSLNLLDSLRPPALAAGGDRSHPLGTDDQGRDVLSGIMYGMRISLSVGAAAIAFAGVAGTLIGLASGYAGGMLDAFLMRAADVQLTFPAILTALLIDGVVSAALPKALHERLQVYVVILAIGISRWPQFARTVRGSTMVERGRDYVLAARVIGLSSPRIVLTHLLPNVIGPALVIATLTLGLAIIDEATLSFLGVGLPVTQPSLGTLIRLGNDFLFSGEWWLTVFPGLALVLIVLSVNLLGDWLRDALNPRLR